VKVRCEFFAFILSVRILNQASMEMSGIQRKNYPLEIVLINFCLFSGTFEFI
jgi:hypothetical protein